MRVREVASANQAANPSIERTSNISLRLLSAAAHVERWAIQITHGRDPRYRHFRSLLLRDGSAPVTRRTKECCQLPLRAVPSLERRRIRNMG
jgi:hypothetical protein